MAGSLRQRGHPVLLTRRLPRRGLAEHRGVPARPVGGPLRAVPRRRRLAGAGGAGPDGQPRSAGAGAAGSSATRCTACRTSTTSAPRRTAIRGVGPGRPGPNWSAPDSLAVAPARTRHPAANLLHIQQNLGPAAGRAWRAYKVSWIGGCVLYDRAHWSTRAASTSGGGAGEPLRARTWPPSSRCWPGTAGPGMLPSGAYHLESPTTVTDRRRSRRGRSSPPTPPSRPEPLPVPAADRRHCPARGLSRRRCPVPGERSSTAASTSPTGTSLTNEPGAGIAVAGTVRVDPRRAVDPADRAAGRPCGDRAVPRAQRRRPCDHVADPEDTHRRGAHRPRQMQRAGVVGDHDRGRRTARRARRARARRPADGSGAPAAATTLSTTVRSAGVPVTSTSNPSSCSTRATSANRRAGQRRRVSLAPGCSVTRGRPGAPSTARACARSASVTASVGTTVTGVRPDQTHHLQVADHLGLVEDVAEPAVQRRGVLGAQPGGDPGTQPTHDRVRVGPAAVHLQRQVVALPGRVGQEVVQRSRRLVGAGIADAGSRRDDQHPVDRAGPVAPERRVPGRTEQHDLRRRICRPQRLQGGQQKDEVAERVGPQHGDPGHVGHPLTSGPPRAGLTTGALRPVEELRRCAGGAAPGPPPGPRRWAYRCGWDRVGSRCGRR